jgi:hypothetical protein
LKNRRRYWESKEEAEDETDGNNILSIEHKEDIQVFLETICKTFMKGPN